MNPPIFAPIPPISETAPPFRWYDRPGVLVWDSEEKVSWPVLKIEYPSRAQFDEVWQWLTDHVGPNDGGNSDHWSFYLQMKMIRDVFYGVEGVPKYEAKKEIPSAFFAVDPQYFALLLLRFK